MCPPIIMALQIASAAAQVVGQKQAADAQADANQRQYQNTMQAYRANINQTNLEHNQEREAAMQKVEQNNLNTRASMARGLTSAGEAGVSGNSVGALLDDLSMRQGRYNSSVTTNYQNAELALDNQRQNIHANASSSINSLKTPPAPDYIGAALRIGTSVSDYDTKYNGGKWFGS